MSLDDVIDDITDEVMKVVSPEGHDPEEWDQVRAAVAKGIDPSLPQSSRKDRELWAFIVAVALILTVVVVLLLSP